MIATLGLTGFRISEMLDVLVAQVDLTHGRFKLADAKTEAGVREVEMTLFLRDELLEHAMNRRSRGFPFAPSDRSSAPLPASGVIRTTSATGSWRGPSSAPTQTAGLPATSRFRR